ncbi:MAG: MarR family transcriptional regulator [Candidatus Marinimicrobia bacterium]|nr:MarR family transcriptional regulator [Candidatus Neomarinimicrobiota bacterium]
MNNKLNSYSEDQRRVLNAWVKLNRATESVGQSDRVIMNEHGLTISQFGAMETLYHKGPMCQKELGDKLLRSGGNMTTVVDNLERGGYINRLRDENDRRFFKIQLTQKGIKKIEEVFPKILANLTNRFSVLTKQEQLSLSGLCKRLGLGIK